MRLRRRSALLVISTLVAVYSVVAVAEQDDEPDWAVAVADLFESFGGGGSSTDGEKLAKMAAEKCAKSEESGQSQKKKDVCIFKGN